MEEKNLRRFIVTILVSSAIMLIVAVVLIFFTSTPDKPNDVVEENGLVLGNAFLPGLTNAFEEQQQTESYLTAPAP